MSMSTLSNQIKTMTALELADLMDPTLQAVADRGWDPAVVAVALQQVGTLALVLHERVMALEAQILKVD